MLRGGALAERDAACPTEVSLAEGCSDMQFDRALPHHERAQTFNTLTNVALGVGGVAAVAGIVWFVLEGRGSQGPAEPARRIGVRVVPRPGGLQLGLGGVF